MENTINTVNISLSEYNNLTSKLSEKTALLDQAKADLNLLKSQEKTNKIVVVEKKAYDQWGSVAKPSVTMTYNIGDPEVSKELLSLVEKVKVGEVEKQLTEANSKIKELSIVVENNSDEMDSIQRSHAATTRKVRQDNEELVRKLKKGYEDTILDLEIQIETISKALADLKVDKTREQIELAHIEEVKALKDEIAALRDFEQEIRYKIDQPIKLIRFVKSFINAKTFASTKSWFNNIWSNRTDAVSNVESFTKLLKSVGKVEKKETDNKCCKKSNGFSPSLEWNGYQYVQVW